MGCLGAGGVVCITAGVVGGAGGVGVGAGGGFVV